MIIWRGDDYMKFYQKNWFMWLMLIFVTPAGLFLMWRNKKFNKPIRIIFTCILSFWFLIYCIVWTAGAEASQSPVDNNPAEQTTGEVTNTNGLPTVTPTDVAMATPSGTEVTTPAPTPEASGGQNTATSGQLKIHFIDVGQADSILLQQGSEFMLIDAGNNEDSQTVKNYLVKQGVTELKYFVGTHKDEDHIGSADYVINSFKVGKVYFPKQTATTNTFKDFVAAVKSNGLSLTVPKVGEQFKLGEAIITVLAPNSSIYDDSNDYSIVLKVAYGNTSFLLTGDAEEVSEGEMVASGRDLSATVLKVGHHGSRTSTSSAFLNKVNPKYAVVSVGTGNSYKHPSQDTMDRLKAKGIKVYRTDEQGTIVATSDGKNVTFSQNPGSYSGISSGASSTSTPTAKPTATPTATITVTPTADFKASVDNATPKQNSTINLTVSGPGGTYTAVCSYKSKDTTYTGDVNTPLSIGIGRAAVGFEVKIDITVTYNGKTYKTSTSFIPQ